MLAPASAIKLTRAAPALARAASTLHLPRHTANLSLDSRLQLNNGVEMPCYGLGTSHNGGACSPTRPPARLLGLSAWGSAACVAWLSLQCMMTPGHTCARILGAAGVMLQCRVCVRAGYASESVERSLQRGVPC